MNNEPKLVFTIAPLKGCGPLQFGMTRAQSVAAIGPADKEFTSNYYPFLDDIRDDHAISVCSFRDDVLVKLTLDFEQCGALHLGQIELLQDPLPDVLAALERANEGIAQAQGGSLYFERLGLALLQFEDPGCRELMLFDGPDTHGEPLAEITVAAALAYYKGQTRDDPANDRLGRACR